MKSYTKKVFIIALCAVMAAPVLVLAVDDQSTGATPGTPATGIQGTGPGLGSTGIQGTGSGLGNTGIQGTVNPSQNSGTLTLTNPLSGVNSIGDLVKNFVEIFSYIAVLIAVVMLIYVGFMYVMSQGKPEKRKDLNSWLLYIVIGVAVVISARLIVDIVINTLDASGTINKNVIQEAKNANSGN